MTKENKRFYQLDYLRGIAAFSVVLFHFTYGYDNGLKIIAADKFYFRYGNLGVQLFFMISGYVIFMTLLNVQKTSDFLRSRFIRLYPAYWASIIVSLVFVNIFENPFDFEKVSLSQFFINLTMLQHWLKVKDIDGAYWTLAVELVFYLFMFILLLINQLKNIITWSFLWLLLCFVTFEFDLPLKKYLVEIFILNHAPLFISGIMFYQLKLKQKNAYVHLVILMCLILEECFLYRLYDSFIPLIIIPIFYVVFYYLTFSDSSKNKPNKILSFFGAISYCLYLIHENIGMTIIFNLKKSIDYQLFYVPVTIIITVLIASLITYYIEKPLMKILKLKLNKYVNNQNEILVNN